LIFIGTFWSISIVDLAFLIFSIIALPETYAPTILTRKAQRLRRETGDKRYHSERELQNIYLSQKLKQNLFRPLSMLAFDAAIQMLAAYSAYLYGMFITPL